MWLSVTVLVYHTQGPGVYGRGRREEEGEEGEREGRRQKGSEGERSLVILEKTSRMLPVQ